MATQMPFYITRIKIPYGTDCKNKCIVIIDSTIHYSAVYTVSVSVIHRIMLMILLEKVDNTHNTGNEKSLAFIVYNYCLLYLTINMKINCAMLWMFEVCIS